MNCVFCNSNETENFTSGIRLYNYCRSCGGAGVIPSHFIDLKSQRARYELHNNSLDQTGYRRYLEKFADAVLDFYGNPSSILDYGCGPEPCLMQLLEEYKHDGRLPAQCAVEGWDPFFRNTELKKPYDMVLCHETAEHFERPAESFAHMAKLCAEGGTLVIATSLMTDRKLFDTWWYKEDITHVSFYSLESLKTCAENAGFDYVKSAENRIFFFTKRVLNG